MPFVTSRIEFLLLHSDPVIVAGQDISLRP